MDAYIHSSRLAHDSWCGVRIVERNIVLEEYRTNATAGSSTLVSRGESRRSR